MKKVWLAGAAAVVVIVMTALTACFADRPEDWAIAKAKAAAEREGIIVGEADIIYDPSNKKWEERVAAVESLPSDPNHGYLPHGMLYNRKYETVLFDFKQDAKRADVWVFLDKDSGDAVTVYQEKQ